MSLIFFVRLMMLFIAVCCARSLAIMVCVSCTLLVPLTFLKLMRCSSRVLLMLLSLSRSASSCA